MPALIVTSAAARAGKSTVAAALAGFLGRDRDDVRLLRLDDSESAAADAALFASVPGVRGDIQPCSAATVPRDSGLTVVEASDVAAAVTLAQAGPDGLLLWVTRDGAPATPPASAAAVVVTMAHPDRMTAARDRAAQAVPPPLGLLPQDGTLAGPSLAEIVAVIDAQILVGEGLADCTLDAVEIGPITAHSRIDHLFHEQAVEPEGAGQLDVARAAITRSNKPDVALAALASGCACLVLTGGRSPLPYVTQHAEEAEIPLLLTQLDTTETVRRLGAIYGRSRFVGPRKVARAIALMEQYIDRALLRRMLALPVGS